MHTVEVMRASASVTHTSHPHSTGSDLAVPADVLRDVGVSVTKLSDLFNYIPDIISEIHDITD